MPLIKHRPDLSLHAPTLLVPGERARGTVVLDAKRAVPIEAVTVDLRGSEQVRIGSGEHATTHRRSLMRLRATLRGPDEIPPGCHTLDFEFDVPGDAPPTYSFGAARVAYEAEVRVDIDWWPDAVERFVLNVGYPEQPPHDPSPRIYSTSPAGPVASRPVLEVSLASEVVALGTTIDVAVGLDNVGGTRFREVRLSLDANETRYDSRGQNRGTVKVQGYELKVPIARALEGMPIRMKLPAGIPPSIDASLFTLAWGLDVRAVVAFGSDVRMHVPLKLVPPGRVRAVDDLAPAPVGSSRQRAVWEEVARASGMTFDGTQMSSRLGEASISVRLGHRDDDVVLVGELEHPTLHLDLDGGVKQGFHRLLRDEVDVSRRDFQRRHYVTGRDPGQVRAFVDALGDDFFAGGLDDVEDERMTFVTPVRTEEALREMCARLRRLAERLGPARAAIPAPRRLDAHLSTWERVAAREEAILERARMALHFEAGDDRASVITEWDGGGEPYRTTAVLLVDDPVDDDYHFLSFARTLGADEATKYPADARELLSSLVEETPHVRVEARALVAHLEPELEDPSNAVAILKRLRTLYGQLRGVTGPYR